MKSLCFFICFSFSALTGAVKSHPIPVDPGPSGNSPPITCDCKCKPEPIIYASFLYWQVIEDGLTFAARTPNQTESTITSGSYETKFIDQGWGFSPGVRVLAGVPNIGDHWNVSGEWTFLRSSSAKEVNSQSHDIYALVSQVAAGLSGNSFVNHASEKFRISFNSIDITSGKSIPLAYNTIFYPLIGVKGAIINQKIDVFYSDYKINSPTATTPGRVFGRNNVWGVGPTAGTTVSFTLPGLWSLWFKSSVATLVGDVESKTTYAHMRNLPDSVKNTFKFNEVRLFPNLSLCFAVDKKILVANAIASISCGWESQIWFRQIRFNKFSTLEDPSYGGDLILQGLSIRAGLGF